MNDAFPSSDSEDEFLYDDLLDIEGSTSGGKSEFKKLNV